jgi:hypothetical protein
MCRFRPLMIGGGAAITLGLTLSSGLTSLVKDVRDGVRPTPSDSFSTQSVDRRHKSNRLPMRGASRGSSYNGEPALGAPVDQPTPILDGCSPAFSPLSSSARLNYPARCTT